MRVYLVRHGVAVARGTKGMADSARSLTADGAARMRRQARALSALGMDAPVILTSPLVRTVQTAELLRDALPGAPTIERTPALRPTARPAAALKVLAERGEEALVLVGHEPMMSELMSLLLAGHSRMAIDFRKGGACLIVFDEGVEPGTGRLVWHLPPRVLRRLARRA